MGSCVCAVVSRGMLKRLLDWSSCPQGLGTAAIALCCAGSCSSPGAGGSQELLCKMLSFPSSQGIIQKTLTWHDTSLQTCQQSRQPALSQAHGSSVAAASRASCAASAVPTRDPRGEAHTEVRTGEHWLNSHAIFLWQQKIVH